MFGAKDTAFRTAASWGARAAKFCPGVGLRKRQSHCVDLGPGYYAAMAGAAAHPEQIKVPPKSEFVSGGWNRNAALQHLRRGDDGQVVCEGGGLGDAFNQYLHSMGTDALERLYLDYTEGIDAWQHLTAEARAELRPDNAEERRARGGRDVPYSEAKNSDKIAENLEAVCAEMTEGIRNGSWRVLGSHEDLKARGELPTHFNRLTWESTKGRLCTDQRALNDMSEWPGISLDGLQVVDDMVAGRDGVYGAVGDETSGYKHHLLNEESQELFAVLFLDTVLVSTVLTFGWAPSCHYHQGHGMVPVGFHREQGGLVSLYVDDHTLTGSEGADRKRTEREVYAFYSLKGTFGYSWSLEKTMRTVARVFTTLGLSCDTEQQAWLVPEEKRVVYREIARDLTAQLEQGEPDLWTLSRFAGKTAYYQRACGNIRRHQNVQYAVLTGRDLNGEVPELNRRWWEVQRTQQRKLTKELREMLLNEIKMCVDLVAAGRVHPFVREEHVTLQAVRRGGVVLYTDTTLDRYGFVLRDAGERVGDCREVISGGIMPEEVGGVQLGGKQTGTVEIAGLELSMEIIDRHAELLVRFTNVRIDLHMDNFEDFRILVTGVVRGEYTVEKLMLAHRVWNYVERWGSILIPHFVPSAENPADEPSRLKYEGEIRLKPEIFNALWAVSGPYEVDGMASQANRVVAPGGEPLPYMSKGLDSGSRGINFFSGAYGRDENGQRERVYVNPPFVMTRAVVRWLKSNRAAGVAVVRAEKAPKPAWQVDLEVHSDRVWRLASPNSEGRRPGSEEGGVWELLPNGPELTAYAFDYEKLPRSEAATVEWLPEI